MKYSIVTAIHIYRYIDIQIYTYLHVSTRIYIYTYLHISTYTYLYILGQDIQADAGRHAAALQAEPRHKGHVTRDT